MLENWLRLALIFEALISIAGALLLSETFGSSLGATVALAILFFFALNALIPIATCILALIHSRSRGLRIDYGRFYGRVLTELLAFLGLYVIFQPFARFWLSFDRRQNISELGAPVLLVHGYLCNRGLWVWFARCLRSHGVPVATINLEPPLTGIDELAADLNRQIEDFPAACENQKIILVGHSMGGLVARAYLRKYGADRIAKLITLGTPHSGTELARLGLGRNARQMQRDSGWIRHLNESAPPNLEIVNVWSETDNFVLPQDCSRLGRAREKVVHTIGHLTMVFSPRILRIVLDEIRKPTA